MNTMHAFSGFGKTEAIVGLDDMRMFYRTSGNSVMNSKFTTSSSSSDTGMRRSNGKRTVF